MMIPKQLPAAKAYIYNALLDTRDRLRGNRDRRIPPRNLMYDGPQDPAIFLANGDEFFQYYIDLCDLKPSETILDIGCGMGRKTIPLLDYLDEAGQYEGMDINAAGVAWCKDMIGREYANFHFQRVDIYNERYNPTGQVTAAEYRFPFEDATFDFVVLGSVFTHMHPNEVENYLAEIGRMLKPDTGRCLISFFLLNEAAQKYIDHGKSALKFIHDLGGYWTSDLTLPENAIAFDEAWVRDLYARCGLNITEPIQFGSWCGRENYLSFQDLVVATKAS